MYGFPGLAKTAALVEEAVGEGQDLELVAELVEELANLCEQIRNGIKRTRSPSM